MCTSTCHLTCIRNYSCSYFFPGKISLPDAASQSLHSFSRSLSSRTLDKGSEKTSQSLCDSTQSLNDSTLGHNTITTITDANAYATNLHCITASAFGNVTVSSLSWIQAIQRRAGLPDDYMIHTKALHGKDGRTASATAKAQQMLRGNQII